MICLLTMKNSSDFSLTERLITRRSNHHDSLWLSAINHEKGAKWFI